MANRDSEKQDQTVVTSPGQILRQAREKKKLEVADIAKKLKLSKQVIINIEDDEYAKVVSLSYMRGYLRSYAKLLDVDVVEVLQAFDALGLTEKVAKPDISVLSSTRGKSLKKHSHRLRNISIVAFVVLIVGVALWWQDKNKNDNQPTSLNSVVQQIIIPASS